MTNELVQRLLAANGGSVQAILGSDIFYQAAERIDFLERSLNKIANPVAAMQTEADEKGQYLDGPMAVVLSEDANWLKDVARTALKAGQ